MTRTKGFVFVPDETVLPRDAGGRGRHRGKPLTFRGERPPPARPPRPPWLEERVGWYRYWASLRLPVPFNGPLLPDLPELTRGHMPERLAGRVG